MYYQPSTTPYAPYDDRTPITASFIRPDKEEGDTRDDPKFQQTGLRDVIFAVLFVFHLVGIAALWLIGLAKGEGDKTPEEEQQEWLPSYSTSFRKVVIVCVISIITGAILSFVWLLIVRKFARQMIILTLIASVILWLCFGVWLMVAGQLIMGIITLVIAAFNALLFFWWRNRIPFATAVLETVSARIEQFPATAYTAYISLVLQILWIVWWVWTLHSAQNITTSSSGADYILSVFLILSFYWTAQVIKNVVHVTVSGVFATWYFMHGTVGIPPNPTIKSLKRATTTSFGSICLGSLLVAALKTLRALIQSMRSEKNALLVFIVDCIVGILDRLLEYFNIYAFTQVAIYGKSYCQAAKDTMQLIKSHGIEAIINDNIISGVLTIGCFIGAVLCGLTAAVLGLIMVPDYWIICGSLGMLIGFVMMLMTMEVVESGVATIFVCFAMDPLALKRNDPVLYHKFSETYSSYISFV